MRGYGEQFWRLVEALARRLCAWCSEECLRGSIEYARRGVLRGSCAHVVRDAMLAAEAGVVWMPPPDLGDEVGVVFEWAARSLYVASVAEVYASRHARRLVSSRGLFTRRVVERILHDYWLASGQRIVVSDVRLDIGWIVVPTLASCGEGTPVNRYELKGGVLRVTASCGDVRLEASVEPPLAARLRVESL